MFTIRTMTLDDYPAVIDLMRSTPGISLREADSRESTARYLERNPGMSFVAEIDGQPAGCIMSGHDGRRGYLQHLVVLPRHRRQGIANALVQRCLSTLESHGILKCHLDVIKTNTSAAEYWHSQGWQLRQDIDRYSFTRSDNHNV
ncbi:GNAT family N-acetyltransferase [Pseudomonas gingeri]|uniref:GNAT family N-acetyltransferase n=1 Tax=Pseudomonas gingeri TaxID=117681 RepID=UPI0015A06674|nr:GNAT family N-acetyltransferase [Pseudomonas gingeri]NWA11694.1 GNAT family N-acetyltransferase [Pseudomonas gingeri]